MITGVRNKLRNYILPLDLIDKNLPPKGKIVDLGCGEGTVALSLANNKARQVIGIDINKKRIPVSRKKNLKFIVDNLNSINLSSIQGAVLSDVLHHLNYKQQYTLISKVYHYLEKGGVLIVKEIDKEELIRSSLSRLWDFLLYPKDKIFFSKKSDFEMVLKKIGFQTRVLRPCRYFPGSTTLYICKK